MRGGIGRLILLGRGEGEGGSWGGDRGSKLRDVGLAMEYCYNLMERRFTGEV